MASTTTSLQSSEPLEDVLAHLPATSTAHYRRRQMIYGPATSSRSIYLVITGTVGISQVAEDGKEVLLEIVRPEELFGESAFLDFPRRSEHATTLQNATVMSWDVSEMEELVLNRPRLALALLQMLAQRNAEFTRSLAAALRRPAFLPVPAFALRVLGDFSHELLDSKRVLPAATLDHGYGFRFPELSPALRDLVG